MKTRKNAEKEWLRRLGAGGTNQKQTEKTKKDKSRSRRSTTAPQTAGPDSKMPEAEKRGFLDVAGMDELKHLVKEGFINVLQNPECAKAFGIYPPNLLFYGPAGCGKTFFAEKIAEEVGINFMKVAPDDIASVYIHGTQEKIGELFRKAEHRAPTLLFFDEFDAMVPRRDASDRHWQHGEVNEFLSMLNNSSQRGIYVLAATNHPERIDKAILRTGRFDEILYVDMPDAQSRESLFRLKLSDLPAAADIDFLKLAKLTEGYSCSDISYIVQVASRQQFNASIREKEAPYKVITQQILEDCIAHKAPTVSGRDLREFQRLRSEFSPRDPKLPSTPHIGFPIGCHYEKEQKALTQTPTLQ